MSFEYAAYLALVVAGTWALKKTFGVRLQARRLAKTLLSVATIFVAWDVLAVASGHWSFNPKFLLGIFIGNQPVEEIAFFFIVPFFYITIWEVCKRQTTADETKKSDANPNAKPKPNEKSIAKRKPNGGRRA